MLPDWLVGVGAGDRPSHRYLFWKGLAYGLVMYRPGRGQGPPGEPHSSAAGEAVLECVVFPVRIRIWRDLLRRMIAKVLCC